MDDLIDFPCSPLWVSHYASRGMTQDYPPEYYEDEETYRRIARLEQEVERLQTLAAMPLVKATEKPKPTKNRGVTV